jgi:pyruvate,orthophosphate dikinase
MANKYVYTFGIDGAEGSGDQKLLLGGKGAGLAEMSRIGLPVPPGFTITTEVCTHFQQHAGAYPASLEAEVRASLASVEAQLGRRFGDPENPLLLSCRSGAPVSMPGMMDTVLNIGLNDQVVAAQAAQGVNPFWIRDSYRRLLLMYGGVVLDVPKEGFEKAIKAAREKLGVKTDAELTPAALDELIKTYEEILAAHGKPFPQDPWQQLWGAIGAVFESWNNKRAKEYRRLYGVPETYGTAVNVQAMVFGNRGNDCATGVAFTRNPSTGKKELYGEFLINAQGEDVVAGIRTPQEISGTPGLGASFPQAHAQLREVAATLEKHFHNMQDVEFTIEADRLYMLQTRNGKRTGLASVKIAVDMVAEGLIDSREALKRVQPSQLLQLLAPIFDPAEKDGAVAGGRLLAKGLPAGPGAASGRIALTAERAAEMAASGPVILVRDETSPEDIVGMHASAGILTSRGGMTSHAAVVARGLGKPCIVGAGALLVDEESGEVRAGAHLLHEGDALSIDGSTGEVIMGSLAPRPSEVVRVVVEGKEALHPELVEMYRQLLTWADAERKLAVRTNADTPHDARVAKAFGAQGIGLCRTEHMFFAEDRIAWVRHMILADSEAEQAKALAHLLPMQQGDFEGILEVLDGMPVNIRLLDPPLHEFLPHEQEAIDALAVQMGVTPGRVADKVASLHEFNPMLGHRGCRLGITHPAIYDMQIEAIVRAACARVKAGGHPVVEIMMPLVGTEQEMIHLRGRTETIVARIQAELGVASLDLHIGTMIEVPRAALVADKIAKWADFFSFGTNDLTQMTYGFSRDDIGQFLQPYLDGKLLPHDPFERLDQEGVGQLVEIATQRGRSVKPNLKVGVCGEHGGEPSSVAFFAKVGLDYVSCSPYRVPIARLAAARAALGYAGDETA